MHYLMIQNPGIAPVECFTILGVSMTRDCGVAGTIGQFGSGSKHAVNLLLRNDINPTIYCGKEKLEFSTKEVIINDGLREKTVNHVCVKRGVAAPKDLGFVLEYGESDWDDPNMAMREFVSNAIDRTIREEGGFKEALKAGRLSVEIVAENQVRAKDGYTRVFLPMVHSVSAFFLTLNKRFLHFSEPESLGRKVLPKRDRNISGHCAMIYKNGVLVREFLADKKASLFDYNFGDDFRLDESRNSSDYDVRTEAAQALRDADVSTLVLMFDALVKAENPWETSFSQYDLSPEHIYNKEMKAAVKQRWQDAWKRSTGDMVAIGTGALEKELVEKRGFRAQTIIHENWLSAITKADIRTTANVLSTHEQAGRLTTEATDAAIRAVDIVWGWIESAGLTMGKAKPPVKGFKSILQNETKLFGYYLGGIVYLDNDHAGTITAEVLHTAMEEVTHYVTGASDMSRDFQNYLLQVIVAICK